MPPGVRERPLPFFTLGVTMSTRALMRVLAFAVLLALPGCLVVTCGP